MSSASDFGRDLGLIHEAVITGRKAGWGQIEWAKLAHDEAMMRKIRLVLLGFGSIKVSETLINCDTDPYVPEGLVVVEHQRDGWFNWDASQVWVAKQVRLYLDESQCVEGGVKGTKLRKSLAAQPVLNANVLDFLLANKQLIPEEWKNTGAHGHGPIISFWGTIYRDGHDLMHVRYLRWYFSEWRTFTGLLHNKWTSNNPTLVHVK